MSGKKRLEIACGCAGSLFVNTFPISEAAEIRGAEAEKEHQTWVGASLSNVGIHTTAT